MKPFSRVAANITKTIGASSIQFLITLVSTPIMTRLYEPSAYATFGIINTMSTVVVGIGLLSLPNAYCAERDPDTRSAMIKAMLLLLAALFLLTLLMTLGVATTDLRNRMGHVPGWTLVMLPVLVVTGGVRQIAVNMAIQRANFTRLSLSQVVEPAISRGSSIALGAAFGGHPGWILASVAAGHLTAVRLLCREASLHLREQGWALIAHIPRLWTTLRKFADFVFFNTASQQAQQVVMLGMQMGIAAFFSAHLAGQYILATSILTLPVSLIALSTAPVVYHHFIDTMHHRPTHLARYFVYAMGMYLLAGTCILAPVFFFGEWLFRVAFGEVWVHAGKIAGVLSIAYVGSFAVTGVQSILMVTRRLKLQFALEMSTCFIALLGALLCFKTMDFDRAIFYLSLIWLFRNILLLCTALIAAMQCSRDATGIPHD